MRPLGTLIQAIALLAFVPFLLNEKLSFMQFKDTESSANTDKEDSNPSTSHLSSYSSVSG